MKNKSTVFALALLLLAQVFAPDTVQAIRGGAVTNGAEGLVDGETPKERVQSDREIHVDEIGIYETCKEDSFLADPNEVLEKGSMNRRVIQNAYVEGEDGSKIPLDPRDYTVFYIPKERTDLTDLLEKKIDFNEHLLGGRQLNEAADDKYTTENVFRILKWRFQIVRRDHTEKPRIVEAVYKVYKNIYPASAKGEKPDYVPDIFVKVAVHPTENAVDEQVKYYYVHPKAKVIIPQKDPKGKGDTRFVKWTVKEDGSDAEEKDITLNETTRNQFRKASTITAQYRGDVIFQEGATKPETVPLNFVEIKFVPTDRATDETKGEKIYWVNQEKEVVIPVKDPSGKPPFLFTGWKIDGGSAGETYEPEMPKKWERATTVTASYIEGKDVISEENADGSKNERPKGYVKVTLVFTEKATENTTRTFWVHPGKVVSIPVDDPVGKTIKREDGSVDSMWRFKGWDAPLRGIFTAEETVITAQYEKINEPAPVDGASRFGLVLYPAGTSGERQGVRGDRAAVCREVRYMQGFQGKFRPADPLTRGEAAQILAEALRKDGYRFDRKRAPSYSDVKGDRWYGDAVKITTRAGVFSGYDDGKFKPQKKITRAEWIAALCRFQYLDKAAGNSFHMPKDHWAVGEVEAAYENGWLSIYAEKKVPFSYDRPISRQEAVAVANRAFHRVMDREYIRKNASSMVHYTDIHGDMWAYDDILCASNTFFHRREGKYIAHERGDSRFGGNDVRIEQDLFRQSPREK
ncbi:MAG: S-layer homology domain-containing protein [Peptoniphilus sp.]|nr:S-layer homology domain-containing protein [Peptoniphilus sp.]MDY3118060.1 S-layer homology domain-containing protein [Peptoniphilus sp.]